LEDEKRRTVAGGRPEKFTLRGGWKFRRFQVATVARPWAGLQFILFVGGGDFFTKIGATTAN
jgi:hypothetical protein